MGGSDRFGGSSTGVDMFMVLSVKYETLFYSSSFTVGNFIPLFKFHFDSPLVVLIVSLCVGFLVVTLGIYYIYIIYHNPLVSTFYQFE